MTDDYPDEPWRLAGEADVSVWTVPRRALPRVPGVVTPLTVAGRAVVVTAWIDYRPPGQLRYHELLSTVAVRHGFAPAASVTEIWVDSIASRDGGRALWGIPKELATFDVHRSGTFDVHHSAERTTSAAVGGRWIATATFGPRGPRTPPIRTAFSVLQEIRGRALPSLVRARVRARTASAGWNVNPDGPLGYLTGRRPLFNVHLSDMRLLFGDPARATGSPTGR